MKSINQLAPVKYSTSITIDLDSQTVWEAITNISDWPTWQTDISFSKLNGELKPGITFDWKSGGINIHSQIHTVQAIKRFGWTGKSMGVFAIHNWVLTEANGQTNVFVEESMEGFLAALLRKSFKKSLEKTLQNWLILLKKECEK